MRQLFCALLFTFLTGCSGQKTPRFIPKAFEYPDDSIGQGKTFIYHDSVHNQDTYLELRSIVRGSDTVQSCFRYNDTAVLDSQIINHGKLIETYRALSSLYPRMYKGEDIVDVTTDDGTKLGRNKNSMTYHNDTVTETISWEGQFIKDTSIIWKGQLLPCLVIQSNGKLEVRSKKYAPLNFTSKGLLYGYYAKNIGLIKYVLTFKDRKNNDHYLPWNLTSIENRKDSIADLRPAL
jgi:hypothetical protein